MPEAVDARPLHDRILTFDAEMDYPPDFMEGAKDAGTETSLQIDLPKMDRGGLDGALFVVWMVTGERDEGGYTKAMEAADHQMAAFEKMLATYPERIGLARSADEAEALVNLTEQTMADLGIHPLVPFLTKMLIEHERRQKD